MKKQWDIFIFIWEYDLPLEIFSFSHSKPEPSRKNNWFKHKYGLLRAFFSILKSFVWIVALKTKRIIPNNKIYWKSFLELEIYIIFWFFLQSFPGNSLDKLEKMESFLEHDEKTIFWSLINLKEGVFIKYSRISNILNMKNQKSKMIQFKFPVKAKNRNMKEYSTYIINKDALLFTLNEPSPIKTWRTPVIWFWRRFQWLLLNNSIERNFDPNLKEIRGFLRSVMNDKFKLHCVNDYID